MNGEINMADINDRIMESERPNDGYKDFELAIKNNFTKIVTKDTPVFKVNVDPEKLWEAYLLNLPKDAQEHYTCNACKAFISKYGKLVTMNEDGIMESAVWLDINIPDFFKPSVNALRKLVNESKTNGIFIATEKILGTPITGVWTHLYVEVPNELINRSRTKSAGQIMAEKLEEYRMLSRSIEKFSDEVVNKVVILAESETLYRGEKVLENAKWFKQLKEDISKCKNDTIKENLIWYYVAKAPKGFAHVNSSMIGTLLSDMVDGLSTPSIIARYNDKMNTYMRSQTAPTAGAIQQAEKIIEDLGLADSLERRFAEYNEIPNEQKLWENKNIVTETIVTKKKGVFAGIAPKNKSTNISDDLNLPITTMTYSKFERTILPSATNLEVKITDPNHLMALVTAKYPDSENILQWNNSFSWYYHGGIDAEMRRRLTEYNAKIENNEIRCSLMWDGPTDLDLHCQSPDGTHMYYPHGSRKDSYGGYLDLDMNGMDKKSNTPVENMRWITAPEGHYKFYVHNYSERGNYSIGTPFKVELEIAGNIYHYEGKPLKNNNKEIVFEFDYKNKQVLNLTGAQSTTATIEDWNISKEFIKVNAIINSPNLWEEQKVIHVGSHIFFILEEVKDLSEGKGRGFFNETLKSELHEIRKTLEAYTAQTPIEGADKASACGVGYSIGNDWNLILKVTSGNSSRLIKIDRFD
jgi:hypothetical protein